ncbi:MAG: hypothetical protein FD167_1052 [bacterium]|nr:MAG: hypothetical protein FD167_1052 [bacterium]
MFVKCVLYIRNYLTKVEYKCSLVEMEFITATIAKNIWRTVDEDKFDERMFW